MPVVPSDANVLIVRKQGDEKVDRALALILRLLPRRSVRLTPGADHPPRQTSQDNVPKRQAAPRTFRKALPTPGVREVACW